MLQSFVLQLLSDRSTMSIRGTHLSLLWEISLWVCQRSCYNPLKIGVQVQLGPRVRSVAGLMLIWGRPVCKLITSGTGIDKSSMPWYNQ